MNLADQIEKGRKAESKEIEEWGLGDYDNGESGCPKCGRHRLCICGNGKHRCEKCHWCPEENRRVYFEWDI